MQGLILDYLGNGDTPELQTAVKTVQTALTYVSQAPWNLTAEPRAI